MEQVPPKVIWEECVVTPHVGKCTLPLCMLAVQYATLRNRYGTLRERYIYGTLWNVTEAFGTLQSVYGSVTVRYVALQSHYGTLRNVAECYGTLRCVAGRYRRLWNVTEALRIVTESYGAVTERYRTVTENIDFAHH